MFPIALALSNIGNNTFKLTNNNSFQRKKSYYVTNKDIIQKINFKLHQLIVRIKDILDKDMDILKNHTQKKHKSIKKYNNPNISILQQMVNDRDAKINTQFEAIKRKIEEITLESTNNIPYYYFDITPSQQSKASTILNVYVNLRTTVPKAKDLIIAFWNSIYLINDNDILRGGAREIQLENHESFIIALLRILVNLPNKVRDKYLFEVCQLILQKLSSIHLIDRYHFKYEIIDNLLPHYKRLCKEKPDCTNKINFNSFLIELQKDANTNPDVDLYTQYQNAVDKKRYLGDLVSTLINYAYIFDICVYNKTTPPPAIYGFTPTPASVKPASVKTIYGFGNTITETNV